MRASSASSLISIFFCFFLSNFRFSQSKSQLGKLLVVTGAQGSGKSETELVNLSHNGHQNGCNRIPEFPMDLKFASGAFVNNEVVICGGKMDFSAVNSQCYSYGFQSKSWNPIGKMKEPRKSAFALQVNGKLFIAGGWNEKDHKLHTTEWFDPKKKESQMGPNLPEKLTSHCMVQINQSTVMIIGGHNGQDFSSATFFFDIAKQEFSLGPQLRHKRSSFGCSILRSENGQKHVIVAGGWNGPRFKFDTTEILDVNNPQKWTEGPRLPRPSYGLEMVSGPDFVLAVGGNGHQISRLDCAAQFCAWKPLKANLSCKRLFHIAVLVPDNFFICS